MSASSLNYTTVWSSCTVNIFLSKNNLPLSRNDSQDEKASKGQIENGHTEYTILSQKNYSFCGFGLKRQSKHI
jgi:hypothetical protein